MTEQMESPEPAETAEPATTPLGDADFRGCRWIAGETTPLRHGMFCCAPTAPGGSWCSRHRKIVWSYRRASLRPVRAVGAG
jgi:hypothetical protein